VGDLIQCRWVARGGLGDTHGHAENLAEGVPKGEHVLLGDGVRSGLEVEPEVVRPTALNEPVGEGRSAILDALAPVVPLLSNDTAGDEQDTVVGWHTALGEDDVA